MAEKIKSKTNKGEFSIISIKYLSELTGIKYQRLYENLVLKLYDSLTINEKTVLANALIIELKKSFKTLGFKVTIDRIN
jgi:hypothetical protein